MSRGKKLLIGGLTFWPFVYIVLFIAFIIASFGLTMSGGGGQEPPALFLGSFGVIFVLHGLTMLLSIALLGYYIYHVVQNDRLDDGNKKVMWIVITIMAGPVGQAIYWYLYIWKARQTVATTPSGTMGVDGRA